jgi:hypothetical protein
MVLFRRTPGKARQTSSRVEPGATPGISNAEAMKPDETLLLVRRGHAPILFGCSGRKLLASLVFAANGHFQS